MLENLFDSIKNFIETSSIGTRDVTEKDIDEFKDECDFIFTFCGCEYEILNVKTLMYAYITLALQKKNPNNADYIMAWFHHQEIRNYINNYSKNEE